MGYVQVGDFQPVSRYISEMVHIADKSRYDISQACTACMILELVLSASMILNLVIAQTVCICFKLNLLLNLSFYVLANLYHIKLEEHIMEILYWAKNGGDAFGNYSAKNEWICMKSGTLCAHCWGLALSDFGRDLCSSNSLRGSGNFDLNF